MSLRGAQQQRFRLGTGTQCLLWITTCLACTCSVSAVENVNATPGQKTPLPDQTEEVEDDRTLLDVFGEVAKEYLTQRMIPDTDVECRWDWRYARCEPFCDCSFIPKLGDYHLGRSCRKREQDLGDAADTCHLPPESAYEKIMIQALVRTKMATQKTKEAVTALSHHSIQKLREEKERTCSGDADEDMTRRAIWKKRVLCRGQDGEAGSWAMDEKVQMDEEDIEELSEKERWELWT